VSDAHESRAESETEVIPAVGSGGAVARTQELPVVEDETVVAPAPVQVETVLAPSPDQVETVVAPSPDQVETVVAPSPDQDETVVAPPPVQASPRSAPAPAAEQPAPVPAPAPAPASDQPPSPVVRPAPAPAPAGTAATGRARGTGWRNAFLALIAVLVIAAVAGVVVARDRAGTAASASGGSAAVAVPATITSLDPAGGSGFRKDSGSAWRTQTYQSAEFGNLKDGVGLLLDLGSAREVATVTLDAVGGPIAVELRSGDEQAASAGGYQKVASADSASGPTTLTPKDAGKHRYWLIWVTRLASQGGGYRAVIRDPAVKGPAS